MPAPTITATNLISGPAQVLVGPGAGVDVGAIEDGVELERTREYLQVESDSEIGGLKEIMLTEQFVFRFNCQEATLVNIQHAFDLSAGPIGNSLSFGGLVGGLPPGGNELQVIIRGIGPAGTFRTVTVYKAVSIGAGTQRYQRRNITVVPVEMRAILDLSKPAGQRICNITDAVPP